jgi:hypothetical protein
VAEPIWKDGRISSMMFEKFSNWHKITYLLIIMPPFFV